MRGYSYKRLLLGLSFLVLALVLLVSLNDYPGSSAHANSPEGQSITVSPQGISYDDRIEITVVGLPSEYTLKTGSVTLAGIKVPVPGYSAHPGKRPKSDERGTLIFTAAVPAGVPLGLQPLTIDIPHVIHASTVVDFLGASLSISPITAIGNQTVLISGSGFTPASVRGDSGPEKVHRIQGNGPSILTLHTRKTVPPPVQLFRESLGQPYLAEDGVEVTLRSLDTNIVGNVTSTTISYTLRNTTEDLKDERSWKLYYSGGGGLPQYGLFDQMLPGQTIKRSYTFNVQSPNIPFVIAYPSRFFADTWEQGDFIAGSWELLPNRRQEPPLETIGLPHVDYPINLDKDGNFFTSVTLPVVKSGNLELRVTDSGGRTGSVNLTVPAPSVTFDRSSAYSGETVRIHGSGFLASNAAMGVENEVRIDYQVVYNEGLASQYYYPWLSKSTIVDGLGNFNAQFVIPQEAQNPSTNRVSITPKYGEVLEVMHRVPSPSITAEPNAAFLNQDTEITVQGIWTDYTIAMGTLTLGGIRLRIPGYFGVPGPKPKTGNTGSVKFSTKIPRNVPTGLQYLDLRLADGRLLRSNLVVLTTALEITPAIVVPGQMVGVKSFDLSPASEGAPGPFGNEQIAGDWLSMITVGGEKLGRSHVSYPIDLDVEGRLFLTLEIPVNVITLGGGHLEMKLKDTGGRIGIGTLNLKTPALTVSPAASIRGSLINVRGEGFVAASPDNPSDYRIDVKYAGHRVATAEPDLLGGFDVSFRIPSETGSGSANVVAAKVRQLDREAKAFHSVPNPDVAIEPASVQRGGRLKVSGTGFPAFQRVWITVQHIWVLDAGVYTDINGAFTAKVTMPHQVPLGEQEIVVHTPSLSLLKTIDLIGR